VVRALADPAERDLLAMRAKTSIAPPRIGSPIRTFLILPLPTASQPIVVDEELPTFVNELESGCARKRGMADR
jgi:hypothetical protein